MNRIKIFNLLKSDVPMEAVLVKGWVRTLRSSKAFSFLEINDGSCLKNIQVIVDDALPDYADIKKLTTGSAVIVKGQLIRSQGKGQKWEISTDHIEIVSIAPESYALQKKRHSDEFLRSIAHLRPRTNKYGAAFRMRSEMSYAVHKFFKDQIFVTYIHLFLPDRTAKVPASYSR